MKEIVEYWTEKECKNWNELEFPEQINKIKEKYGDEFIEFDLYKFEFNLDKTKLKCTFKLFEKEEE